MKEFLDKLSEEVAKAVGAQLGPKVPTWDFPKEQIIVPLRKLPLVFREESIRRAVMKADEIGGVGIEDIIFKRTKFPSAAGSTVEFVRFMVVLRSADDPEAGATDTLMVSMCMDAPAFFISIR